MRTPFLVLTLVVGAAALGFAMRPKRYQPATRSEVHYVAGGSENLPPPDSAYDSTINWPQDLGDLGYGTAGEVSLIALPEENRRYENRYVGFRVLVINRTAVQVPFEACDQALFLTCEALSPNGKWRAIESVPRSICGNSYYNVTLPSGSFWEFAAPRYSGEFKTRLRFKLKSRRGKQVDKPILSNEFEGAINLGQFDVPPNEEFNFPPDPENEEH